MKPVQFIEHEGRALLALPSFELFHRQPDPPHTAYAILSKIVPNEHGTSVKYKIKTARRGKKTWWISASYGVMRASNTLRTTSVEVAQLWIQYVTRGDVCVADPNAELTPTQLKMLVVLKDDGPLKFLDESRRTPILDVLVKRKFVVKVTGLGGGAVYYSITDEGRKAFHDASPSCAQSMGTLCAHHSAGFRTWKDPCNANEVRP